MKDENALASCFGIFFVLVISIVGGAIMSGWVLSILWAWFVLPVFSGLPTLSIPLAIGFSLTVGMMTKNNTYQKNDKKSTSELLVELLGTAFLSPLFVLLIGWIVKSFM